MTAHQWADLALYLLSSNGAALGFGLYLTIRGLKGCGL